MKIQLSALLVILWVNPPVNSEFPSHNIRWHVYWIWFIKNGSLLDNWYLKMKVFVKRLQLEAAIVQSKGCDFA